VQFQCIPAFHRAVAGATARLAADAVAIDDAFRCRSLQVVASLTSACNPTGTHGAGGELRLAVRALEGQVAAQRSERTSRRTIGSKRFYPLPKSASRSASSMLVRMRAHSARPLPLPKCSSARAATLPAPPAALSPIYTDVVRRESMAVTTSIGNFVGGNLAAAISAREWNDSHTISRDQAPATN
jgi:hypothetical protein